VGGRLQRIWHELRRSGLRGSLERVRRDLKIFGLRGTLHRAGAAGVPYWWHVLDLSAPIAERPFVDGVELLRATTDDLDIYEPVADPQDLALAPGWMGEGNELWLAAAGRTPAFACWVFRRRMPMGQAAGGWLNMPEGTAFLEHSVTAADFRGKGIAPAAWAAIAERLRDDQVRTLVTKVTEDNVVTQKSLAKVGFVRAERDDPVVRDFARQGADG
jgi:RimJ/RimL family protein N-acetyltransferase